MEKKNTTLTGSVGGDLIFIICFIVITVIAVTGILHHGNEWGLYALLWVAAVEGYSARTLIGRHIRKQNESNG